MQRKRVKCAVDSVPIRPPSHIGAAAPICEGTRPYLCERPPETVFYTVSVWGKLLLYQLLCYFQTFLLLPSTALDLLLEWVTFRVLADNPAKGIDEEQVLCCIDKAFVTVTHVQVNHPILLVCPDDREVAELDDIFQTERVHLWRDGEQHFHIRILSWAGVPLIELTCR